MIIESEATMADNFLFSDYWPKPKVGELVVYDYGVTAGLHLSSITSNSGDNKTFYLDDYTDNKWTATWVNNYYYYSSKGEYKGIMEVADWYPATDARKIWGPIRNTVFVKGYEIAWGGIQKVGDKIDVPLKIDSLKSTFFTGPATGRQIVAFVNRYDTFKSLNGSSYTDVLEIAYDQSWGSKTSGARYWYARAQGIVQMQWRGNGADVGSPMPVTITTLKGYINKDRYPVLG